MFTRNIKLLFEYIVQITEFLEQRTFSAIDFHGLKLSTGMIGSGVNFRGKRSKMKLENGEWGSGFI